MFTFGILAIVLHKGTKTSGDCWVSSCGRFKLSGLQIIQKNGNGCCIGQFHMLLWVALV